MATSVPINIITGRTGTAHVSSGDDASIWRGLVGSANVVLSQGSKLELQDNGVVNNMGSLTIRDGVFSTAGGHMGRIADAHTVEYNLPSENNYRRTMVVIRYLNVSTTESMTLMTLQNAQEDDKSPQSSSQSDVDAAINAAKVLTVVGYDSSSDYILYDFVCSADGIVSGTLETMFTTVDNIPMLRESVELEKLARTQDVSTLSTRITTADGEISTLQGQTSNLMPRVSSAETGINDLTTRMSAAEPKITNLQSNMTTARSDITSLKSRMTTAESNINNYVKADAYTSTGVVTRYSDGVFKITVDGLSYIQNYGICVAFFRGRNGFGDASVVLAQYEDSTLVMQGKYDNAECLFCADVFVSSNDIMIKYPRFYGRWSTSYQVVAITNNNNIPIGSVKVKLLGKKED